MESISNMLLDIYTKVGVRKIYNNGDICHNCGQIFVLNHMYLQPIKLCDLLDYIEKNDYFQITKSHFLEIIFPQIFLKWKNKREPIEKQGKDCILYFYNFINGIK